MIEEKSYDRLIGDFIEINADIVQEQFYSKYPKIVSKIIAKNHRKKLLKSVKKLRNSDIILNCNNLYEFFMILYNNYPPEGNFGDVIRVLYSEQRKMLEGSMIFDNYTVLINIDETSKGFFNIKAKKTNGDGTHVGMDLTTRNLSSKKKEFADMYFDINKQILSNICDYIEKMIRLYMEEK